KIDVWTANLHIVVIAFPIFIAPIKNESADADLPVSRVSKIGFNRIPLGVKESGHGLSVEVRAALTPYPFLAQRPSSSAAVRSLTVKRLRPRRRWRAPFAKDQWFLGTIRRLRVAAET